MADIGGGRRRRRGWVVAAAASAAIHVGVLVALLHRRVEAVPQAPPPVQVWLIRPAETEAETTPAPPRQTPAEVAELSPPPSPVREGRQGAVAAPPPPFVRPVPAAGGRGGGAQPAPQAGPSGVPGAAEPPRAPGRPPPRPDDGERVRSFLRSAGCETGTASLTPRERERCQERFGASREGEPLPAQHEWAKRRRGDEARRQARKSLFDDNDSSAPRGSAGVLMGGGGGAGVGVVVPFGKPPPALPNIPASTLRGDDDALRPKPRPKPRPAEEPGS